MHNFSKALKIGFISFNLSSLKKSCWRFERFHLALFKNHHWKKMFEFSTAFFKATQTKRDESDFQSLTKVLYHQKPFQIYENLLKWLLKLSLPNLISDKQFHFFTYRNSIIPYQNTNFYFIFYDACHFAKFVLFAKLLFWPEKKRTSSQAANYCYHFKQKLRISFLSWTSRRKVVIPSIQSLLLPCWDPK